MILFVNGQEIRLYYKEKDQLPDDVHIPAWFSLEFAGALLAALFWVSMLHKLLHLWLHVTQYTYSILL